MTSGASAHREGCITDTSFCSAHRGHVHLGMNDRIEIGVSSTSSDVNLKVEPITTSARRTRSVPYRGHYFDTSADNSPDKETTTVASTDDEEFFYEGGRLSYPDNSPGKETTTVASTDDEEFFYEGGRLSYRAARDTEDAQEDVDRTKRSYAWYAWFPRKRNNTVVLRQKRSCKCIFYVDGHCICRNPFMRSTYCSSCLYFVNDECICKEEDFSKVRWPRSIMLDPQLFTQSLMFQFCASTRLGTYKINCEGEHVDFFKKGYTIERSNVTANIRVALSALYTFLSREVFRMTKLLPPIRSNDALDHLYELDSVFCRDYYDFTKNMTTKLIAICPVLGSLIADLTEVRINANPSAEDVDFGRRDLDPRQIDFICSRRPRLCSRLVTWLHATEVLDVGTSTYTFKPETPSYYPVLRGCYTRPERCQQLYTILKSGGSSGSLHPLSFERVSTVRSDSTFPSVPVPSSPDDSTTLDTTSKGASVPPLDTTSKSGVPVSPLDTTSKSGASVPPLDTTSKGASVPLDTTSDSGVSVSSLDKTTSKFGDAVSTAEGSVSSAQDDSASTAVGPASSGDSTAPPDICVNGTSCDYPVTGPPDGPVGPPLPNSIVTVSNLCNCECSCGAQVSRSTCSCRHPITMNDGLVCKCLCSCRKVHPSSCSCEEPRRRYTRETTGWPPQVDYWPDDHFNVYPQSNVDGYNSRELEHDAQQHIVDIA